MPSARLVLSSRWYLVDPVTWEASGRVLEKFSAGGAEDNTKTFPLRSGGGLGAAR